MSGGSLLEPNRSTKDGNGHQPTAVEAARSRRYLRYLLGFLLLLLVADAAYVGITLKSSLESSRDDLASAEAAFKTGHFSDAAADLRRAEESAHRAASTRWHPATIIAGLIPWIDDDLHATQHLTDAVRFAAQGGSEAVDAIMSARAGSHKLAAAIYKGGRVDFSAIDRAEPHVRSALALLRDARAAVTSAPKANVGVISDAVSDGGRRIASTIDSAEKAESLLGMLPNLLGRDGQRQYFLAFQSPSEERGTGGLIGFDGILHAADGRLRLTSVGSIKRLESKLHEPVVAPAWFERQYAKFGATEQWRQANFSPDFPTVAQVLLKMYERAKHTQLDGVLAMDPIALADLMKGTGPLETSRGEVSADSVAKLLLGDSYTLPPRQQNAVISELIGSFWRSVSSGVDAPKFAAGLGDAVETQHFKVYARDSSIESQLARLGADGDYTRYGPNVQFVYNNNIGQNKTDYFLRRDIKTSIAISPTGSASIHLEVTWKNDAPAGPPSALLGNSQTAARKGQLDMQNNFLVPKNSRFGKIAQDGFHYALIQGQDAGFPRGWTTTLLRPGHSSHAVLTYVIPQAVDLAAPEPRFSFTLFPQASVHVDTFTFNLTPPVGFRLESPDSPGNAIEASGTLDRPITYSVVLINSR